MLQTYHPKIVATLTVVIRVIARVNNRRFTLGNSSCGILPSSVYIVHVRVMNKVLCLR